MPPKLISNQALSTVENIALLSLLNRTPTLPGDNVRQISHSKQDVSRILSFDCEISLTSTLAFLSGVSDDPGHVVAVCVEELIDSSGLRVLVAINKKNPESGIGVLGRIEEGLGKIFGYLSRAGCGSAKNNVSLETQVLAAILDMCERRIFSRIRSKRFESRYSKKDKPSFTTVIKDVLEVVNRNRGKKRVLPEVKGFIDTTTKLAKLLDRLEVCQTKDVRSCLEDILKAASELAENTIFDNIFSGATSVELATSTKLDFINRLSRLARYYQCPGFLVKLAKRSGLFKKTTITTVALDAKYFTRCMTGTAGCSLAGCLDRCQTGTFPPFGVKGISRRLGKNQTEANTAFQNAIAETLSESKIHAEVQIIAFYELYKVPRKPRVICSSKDACYLCHQFVRLHGLFHIPKTHGNLYTRWRVPPVPSLGPLKDMLEESLGAQIRKEIQAFQTDPERKTKYTKHENESSIFPFAQLMSSLDSIPTPSEDPANKIVTKKTIKKNAEQQSASGLVATLPEVPQPQLMSPAPSCAQEQLQQITPSPAAPERTANSEESYSQTGSQQKSEQKQIFQPLKSSLSLEKTSPPSNFPAGLCLTPYRPANKQDVKRLDPIDEAPEPSSEPKTGVKPNLSSVTITLPMREEPPEQSPTPDPSPIAGSNTEETSEPPHRYSPTHQPGNPHNATIHSCSHSPPPPAIPSPTPSIPPLPPYKPLAPDPASPSPFHSHTPSIAQSSSSSPSSLSNSSTSPSLSNTNRIILLPGQTINISPPSFSSTSPFHSILPCYSAGSLDIYPEIFFSTNASPSPSSSSSSRTQPPPVSEIRIHHLDQRRAKAMYVAQPRGLIRIDSREKGVDLDTSGGGDAIYLAHKGDVVMIEIVRKEGGDMGIRQG